MSQIFDFSKALLRCSAIYYIVADGQTKTPKQKYEYLKAVLAEEVGKYEEMGERKQGMANGLKKASKIAGLEYELKLLEPKKNDDPLSKGAKSYLKRLYGELKYGKWSASKEKGNKYTEKGKIVQPEAILLCSELDDVLYEENFDRIQNEFLSGVPDAFLGKSIREAEYIVDVKSSWDFETFIENLDVSLNPLYWWQIQGYMELSGATKGDISYCLINTPDSILEEEKYKLIKRLDVVTTESPEYRLKEAELVNNMTFNDIIPSERRLKFEVTKDQEAINKIYSKIPQAREYLFYLQELHLKGVFSDKELPMLETFEEI